MLANDNYYYYQDQLKTEEIMTYLVSSTCNVVQCEVEGQTAL